jgi:hypothetical protein
MEIWHQNNLPKRDQLELMLNDEPSRKQWSRWFDELGLTKQILPRNQGGRGK